MVELTVIIPTHNPDMGRLRRALLGLKAQTLAAARWETIVVNNASARFPDASRLDDCAPGKNFHVVDEPNLGLTSGPSVWSGQIARRTLRICR